MPSKLATPLATPLSRPLAEGLNPRGGGVSVRVSESRISLFESAMPSDVVFLSSLIATLACSKAAGVIRFFFIPDSLSFWAGF